MSEFEVAIKIAGKLDKSLQTSVSSAQKMLGSLGKGGLSSALTGIGMQWKVPEKRSPQESRCR